MNGRGDSDLISARGICDAVDRETLPESVRYQQQLQLVRFESLCWQAWDKHSLFPVLFRMRLDKDDGDVGYLFVIGMRVCCF